MIRRQYVLFLLFIFLNMPFANAAEAAAAPLSLEAALRTAFENNPQMIEYRQQIHAARGRRWQAEALPDPEIELTIGGFKDGNHSTDQIAIRQPLDPPGTRFLRASIAKDEVEMASNDLLSVWGSVRSRVTNLYYQILAVEKAYEIAYENLNTTRQFFTRVETRYQSGDALHTELIRARLEVAGAESGLLVAQKNLKVAKGNLNLELGRDIENGIELADALEYRPLTYKLAQSQMDGRKNRADLKNEEIRLKSKKKNVWKEFLEMIFPSLSVGIERTTEEFENDTALLIEASYPLWGFNLGGVKEAAAEKDVQEIRLNSLQKKIALEIYEAYLEAELAEKQIELQKRAGLEANELLRQVTIQYEEGKMPFIVYLENIQTIKETRLAYYEVLQGYHSKVARLESVIQATPLLEERTL